VFVILPQTFGVLELHAREAPNRMGGFLALACHWAMAARSEPANSKAQGVGVEPVGLNGSGQSMGKKPTRGRPVFRFFSVLQIPDIDADNRGSQG
jgi:hypothetical protein